MSKKPVIGIIPTYNLKIDENDPYKDNASFVRMYSEMITLAGGIPIGILEQDAKIYTSICDGYVWPGGSKIWHEFDVLLKDAIKNKKPVLGVCLGAQAISTFFNVLEDQKLNKEKSFQETYEEFKEKNPYLKKLEENNMHLHEVTKEESTINNAKHQIKIIKSSLLHSIYGCEKLDAVSLHSIVIARTPKCCLVSAYAEDKVLEAIEFRENGSLILGVQYHPEIVSDKKIFDWLISSCNKYLILVNQENEIKYRENYQIKEYKSEYPICINDGNIEELAYTAWIKFRDFLREKGYYAEIESAYRSKEVQEEIYKQIEKEKGSEYAKKYVAKPGFSEHELGLALDICLKLNGEWLTGFDEKLKDFYQIIQKYCADFGFVLRYPKNKESITGYNYEPWHIRYIDSIEIAKKIMERNLTLEEYLDKKEQECQK